MGFYFDGLETRATAGPISKDTLWKAECAACPLNNAKNTSPKMLPSGNPKAEIYFLGEAPGATEDAEGEPFVGDSGEVLKRAVVKAFNEYDPDTSDWDVIRRYCSERFRFGNVIRDRPPKNRAPVWQEIECCRPSVIHDIEEVAPKVLVTIGGVALNWAIQRSEMIVWSGRRMPVRIGKHICWLYPIVHPSWLLRMRRKNRAGETMPSEYEIFFEKHLSRIHYDLCEGLPEPAVVADAAAVEGVVCITGDAGDADVRRVKMALEKYASLPEVGVDIETANPKETNFRKLRPYGDGARIVSCAIGTWEDTTSFVLDHSKAGWSAENKAEVKRLLVEFLAHSRCIKVAHHSQFELEWLSYIFKADLIHRSPWGDTMVQGHVLDERKGALGLDDLTLLHFGLDIKTLFALDKNHMDRMPLDKVLLYNGVDSKFTHGLYKRQEDILKEECLWHVYEDQVQRCSTLSATQLRGVPISQSEIEGHSSRLEKAIVKTTKQIQTLPDVKKFVAQHLGFNPGSPQQVQEFLHSVGIHLDSADEAALEKTQHPIAPFILELRSLAKMKSTYVDSIHPVTGKYSWPDGRLHPKLNGLGTKTGRTSSDEPNEQNFPKRKHKEIRSSIKASPGHVLVSADYGQIEFRAIAMVFKDEKLCRRIRERYDVHAEWAGKFDEVYPGFFSSRKTEKDPGGRKEGRQDAKNKFVFPSCYGAIPDSIADNIGLPKDVVREVQGAFWEEFPAIPEGHKRLRAFYKRHDYVECLDGLRRRGPLDGNKVINSPIQGTAANIVIRGMNLISTDSVKAGIPWLTPIMNIHDDLTFEVPFDCVEDGIKHIVKRMLSVDYEFINVPLSVEVSMGLDWYDMEEVGTFFSDDPEFTL